MSDYALTGLKDGFIGAASGAIFEPGAAIGTAFARKVGMAGAEGAFSSIMDQVLHGEKINWSTVAKDAGIGMLTLGVLDSKVGQKFTGFVGKVGNEVTPDWVKKGVTKANEGFEKAVDKLSDAGSKLGKKLKKKDAFELAPELLDDYTKSIRDGSRYGPDFKPAVASVAVDATKTSRNLSK